MSYGQRESDEAEQAVVVRGESYSDDSSRRTTRTRSAWPEADTEPVRPAEVASITFPPAEGTVIETWPRESAFRVHRLNVGRPSFAYEYVTAAFPTKARQLRQYDLHVSRVRFILHTFLAMPPQLSVW